METPEDLKFSETDEWIKIDGDDAYIGISDYAQHELSDIVFVEYMLDIEDEFEKDESVVTIESVKAAADVHAPVSGTVLEVNESLLDNPEFINEDPYTNWLMKLSIKNPDEFNSLMDADAYDRFCKDRDD